MVVQSGLLLDERLKHKLDFSGFTFPDVITMSQQKEQVMQAAGFRTVAPVRDMRPLFDYRDIFFAWGGKDRWCAWVRRQMPDGSFMCACPRDKHYFEVMWELAGLYGVEPVWNDMLHIFERTRFEVDDDVISEIQQRALRYQAHQGDFYNAAMSIYYGMIAEAYYIGPSGQPTRFGKLVKINGLYSFLKGGRTVEQAADECRLTNWRSIEEEAHQRHLFLSAPYQRELREVTDNQRKDGIGYE